MNAFPPAVRRFGYAAAEVRAAGAHQVEPHGRPETVRIRLWLPTTALFLLLAPIPMALWPLGYLVPRPRGIDPLFAVLAAGDLLLALSGTEVVVDTADADIRIKLV